VVTRLEGLLGHDDHRVRVEALRALIKQQGLNGISVAIRMLGDEHERVREATAAMLRTWDEPRVDQGLVSAVHSPDLPFESVAEAVAVLAARGTPAARSEVDRLAAPNFALGRARRLRKVARDVRTWEK
jgi:HEAT repeat protein